MAKFLTISLLLLFVFCCVVNTTAAGSPMGSIPGPLVLKGNLRKALKVCLQERQVSALLLLTILLSNDVSQNPGPNYKDFYPCGMCQQNVEDSAIACDNCSIWYHRECLEICAADLDMLGRSNVSWICFKCDSMNCGTFTFQSCFLDNSHSSNYYYPLMELDSSIDSFHSSQGFSPAFKSSPKEISHHSSRSNQSLSFHINGKLSSHESKSQSHIGSREKRNVTSRQDSSNIYDLPKKKQNLRFLNVNCQSVVNKRAEFAALLDYIKPDVVCGTESWLQKGNMSTEVFPKSYEVYRKDRGTLGGGAFILVHKSLISTDDVKLEADCETVWAKIQLKGSRDLLVGCFYMPERSHADLEQLDALLNKISVKQHGKQVILAGDFNCPDVNWENCTVPPGAQDRTVQEELVNITTNAHLTQIHNQPTRLGNTLDLLFVSNPSLAKHTTSVPGCSDHDAVVADFDTRPRRSKEKPRKCQLFSKANWDNITEDLSGLAEKVNSMKEEGADVNNLWETFKNTILSVVEKHVPSTLRRNRDDLPWMSRYIKKLLRRKIRLHKKARKSNNWANYRFCQKECRRAMRKAEQDYINNIIETGLKENNRKPFWKYIKSRRQDNTGVSPLKEGANLISDSQSKARILLQQFRSVFTKNNSSPLPQMSGRQRPQIDKLTVRKEGIAKLLQNLNPSKASGPDGIPSKILKNCAEILASPLTCIYNHSLETGQLPVDWLTANVCCVFKKGDRSRPENYRPVSLTSVACKILEHVICHHIREHLEKYSILTNKNHGFRKGFSCETQLLTTMHDLLKSNDAGNQTDVMILDFSKAFDTVPHAQLLHKLQHYGITGPVHKWISQFLTQRTMKVTLEGETSEETAVESGVPQGTVLGPLLFLCHINDLPDAVSANSKVRLFADDCLLYRDIRDFQDHVSLQEDLVKLEEWAKKWGMRFNAKKCNILRTRNQSSFFYKLDGEILQQVDHTPYLGVQISADLKWATHITNICKKASSTLGFLRRNLGSCPQECRRLAYITLVRSVLEYGASIWDPYLVKDQNRLERVQRQAARFIRRDYRSQNPGCVTRMLEELGLPTLLERRKHHRLTTLYKIIEGHLPALPPEEFLTPADNTKRKIKTKTFTDHMATNIIAKYAYNNSRGYKVPQSKTEQYERSFFVQSVNDWNKLPEEVVQADSSAAFSAALGRAALTATPY